MQTLNTHFHLLVISQTFLLISSYIFVVTLPIYSLLLLIFCFIEAALILFLFNLDFLALAFIMIYIGAVAVLFLFVIMMINTKDIIRFKSYEFFFYKYIKFFFIFFVSKFFFIWVLFAVTFLFLPEIVLINFNTFFNSTILFNLEKVANITSQKLIYILKGLETLKLLLEYEELLVISKESIENYQFVSNWLTMPELEYFEDLQNDITFLKRILFELKEDKILAELIHAQLPLYENSFFNEYQTLVPLYFFIKNFYYLKQVYLTDFTEPLILLGQKLFNFNGILFLIAGFILVIALVGSISLTLKNLSLKEIKRPLSKNKNNIHNFK